MSSKELQAHHIARAALDVSLEVHSAELDVRIGNTEHLKYLIGNLVNELHEAFDFADIDLEECRQVYLNKLPEIKARNARRREILEAAE